MLLAWLAVTLAAFVEHPLPPSARVGGFVEVNEILCETPQYAIDLAAAESKGDAEEFAKDAVGKRAHREVCGRYIGLAVPEKASIATAGGVVYQLKAYRFKEDDRIGWQAETTFAPSADDHEMHL